MANPFTVVGYYDAENDLYYCCDCRPINWRDLLALLTADIPGVDESDDPPLCICCGHYL